MRKQPDGSYHDPSPQWSPLANSLRCRIQAVQPFYGGSSPIDKKGRCVFVGLAKDFGPKVLVSLERHCLKSIGRKNCSHAYIISVFESSYHNRLARGLLFGQ